MNKSTHFTGQPVFCQILSHIPRGIVSDIAQEFNADRYCKGFDTWTHLTTMLFACYGNCTSLREITVGMQALEGKLQNCGIKKFPARSTFSDANLRRSEKVFEQIYYRVKAHWETFLPDSQSKNRIRIFDSTSISLFKEIFKGAGMSKQDGRRKGGVKVHVTMRDGEACPGSIMFSDAARNDLILLPYLEEEETDILIFDRGYRSYAHYVKWTKKGTLYVTRLKDNTYIEEKTPLSMTDDQIKTGIQGDWMVKIGHPARKVSLQARLVYYKDPRTGNLFKILTNYYDMDALTIAQLYKKRWQIELLFKRLKQNMPLNYFIGDNQNAIKIQIWCAFIADMLLQIIRSNIKKSWAFSNIVNLVRLHLFNYLNLKSFLENPRSCKISILPDNGQTRLSLSG